MASLTAMAHTPVQKAHTKLRAMSADEEERYWAEARERALSDEVTLLNAARREGREEGREQGREQGAAESSRRLLKRQTHRRFGEAAAEQSTPLLERIGNADRLEALADDVVLCADADAWLARLHGLIERPGCTSAPQKRTLGWISFNRVMTLIRRRVTADCTVVSGAVSGFLC